MFGSLLKRFFKPFAWIRFIFNDMGAPSRNLHAQTVPEPSAKFSCIGHSLNRDHRTGTPLGSTKLKLEFFLIRQRRSLIFRGINYDTRGVSFIGNLYPDMCHFNICVWGDLKINTPWWWLGQWFLVLGFIVVVLSTFNGHKPSRKSLTFI